MKKIETPIKDLYILEPTIFNDERGYFYESYSVKKMQELGLDYNFIQQNQSKSGYGTIRGLHFQKGEFAQTKLVRVTEGSVIDAVVDLRPDSSTYGKSFSVELSATNHRQLLIPRGFAHGFSVISETAVFNYQCDNFYNKQSEGGLAYNDESLKIDWKIKKGEELLSGKDKTWPNLDELSKDIFIVYENFLKSTELPILIIGATGMLGQTFVENFNLLKIPYLNPSSKELDITDKSSIGNYFSNNRFKSVINCSGYTKVDQAEDEKDLCSQINTKGVEYLGNSCKNKNIRLIQFSTDYVYNGSNSVPYKEEESGNCVNFYGQSKLDGERALLENNIDCIIFRISWLYSKNLNINGKNFYKTIVSLGKEKSEINVVDDQIGCPTTCQSVVELVLQFIDNPKVIGIYNFSGSKIMSWAQFAKNIMKENNLKCEVKPVSTEQYPTKAKRPKYSVMCLDKINTHA